ncbi:MAG TPA: putative aminohydrolase SsnA [Anaerolineales bacterium]|nr:putative aminohydrolase SsnA [Anaerolineales bacterium]
MSEYLITNGILITWERENRVLESQAVYLKEDRIAEIGPQADLLARYPDAEVLDAHGQYVMPGNICAHTHFYGAFSRGMGIPGAAPKDFPDILRKLWWPLDKALDMDAVRASAEVMLVDAIRHGTTTLIDHHASPNAIAGSLDTIAEAVDLSGLRAVLCYEVTDRDGAEKSQAGIAENVRFINHLKEAPHPRLGATFGLHASLTLSDETLAKCVRAAPKGTGFHIHVAEHPADEYDSLAKSGRRVVDRLAGFGMLGPDSILVHGVHIDAGEAVLLAETQTWLTHQPRSNMNNAVGAADIESLLRLGIKVCLGTDGFSSTMWEEMKFAYLLQKVWQRDPRRMPGNEVVRMAAYHNAELAQRFFPDAPLGRLVPGAYADIILVNYHPYTPLTPGNLPWQILFGFHESMVTTTIAAGKILMRDHQLLTMDEAAITARARELAPQVWENYQNLVPAD